MGAELASVPATENSLDFLVDAVLAQRNQSLERAETLPPEAYTSAAFYRLETEKIFRRDWLCVGHVSQVPNEGDYFTTDLFGEMLVTVRGKDRIRVLSRVCRHRWAPVAAGAGNAKLFSCPFHKWAYALDGRLLGAPLMEEVEFDRDTCRLPEYRSEIIAGFIFMCFAPDTESLAAQLPELTSALAKFELDTLLLGASLEYDCAVNWKIVVETFMECYHHIATHPITFERTFPARLSYVEDGRAAWTIGHSPARPELPDESVRAGFPLLAELTPAERREFRLYVIYPYHLLSVLPDRVFWFCLQPEGPARTRLQTHILVAPSAPADPDFAEKIEAERQFLNRANIEDITVNELQQRGAEAPSAAPGRLSHLEKAIWQLADYVRDRLADGAAPDWSRAGNAD
jgi:phenylpropionate dioxygenase-like ring-hydroxylating dioxygenase large terminal subunit